MMPALMFVPPVMLVIFSIIAKLYPTMLWRAETAMKRKSIHVECGIPQYLHGQIAVREKTYSDIWRHISLILQTYMSSIC